MSADSAEPPLQCPVCNARFRGTAKCARCGADLAPLHLAASVAWRRTADARMELLAARYDRAAELFRAADELRHTGPCDRARLIAGWLASRSRE